MDKVFFDNPPILTGKPEEQLKALYGYLGMVSNKLNEAMMSVSIEETRAEEQRVQAVQTGGEAEQQQSDFIRTKSLILKTAELVRTEMEEIRTTLNSSIEAVSEQFGTYQQNITQQITATANGLLAQLKIEEKITDAETKINNFITSQSSYIFAGIIDQVEKTTGIAIGEGVTDENGDLVDENKVVTITPKQITFYQGGAVVAYFGDNNFYISNGVVTNSMTMGNFMWKVFSNGSVGLMKI